MVEIFIGNFLMKKSKRFFDEIDESFRVIDNFIKSANEGNIEHLQQLLQVVNVNSQDSRGRTALHMAAAKGDLSVVKFLLNLGADCSIPDLMGNTSLHLATIGGKSEIVSLMLKYSSKIEMTRDMYGKTPLGWAKSRLSRLKQSSDNSASLLRIQNEIASIINILAEYCKKRGMSTEDTETLDILNKKIEHMKTIDDVDEIENLLENLKLIFLLATDIGFIAYWIISALYIIPPEYVFKDYSNPILQSWNWSFLPLDLLISITGFTAVILYRCKCMQFQKVSILTLALTHCSGLQAIAFWAIRKDVEALWWIPNLFLMIYPLLFIPTLIYFPPEHFFPTPQYVADVL